ncbi:hypothetical protein R1sor_011736 [Riccia sorocarpa]|uniref:Uncharacterized protein n=1 Tax=Riccia sorocarpa TaxID=122646 RepID=A0ABD3I5D3_9MARC
MNVPAKDRNEPHTIGETSKRLDEHSAEKSGCGGQDQGSGEGTGRATKDETIVRAMRHPSIWRECRTNEMHDHVDVHPLPARSPANVAGDRELTPAPVLDNHGPCKPRCTADLGSSASSRQPRPDVNLPDFFLGNH